MKTDILKLAEETSGMPAEHVRRVEGGQLQHIDDELHQQQLQDQRHSPNCVI